MDLAGWRESGKCRLFSDTSFAECVICTPYPPARIIGLFFFFFFFAFPVPLSQQSKGLESWRDAESKEVQTGSRSAAGWGGRGAGRVKASPPAAPRPRMRTGAGPLWVGCPSPVSANLSEKGGDDGSSRPESPARRRAAAPRSGDGCRSKRPAVLGRTLLPAGLQNVNASNVSVPSLSGC